jgi:hypothetical protein
MAGIMRKEEKKKRRITRRTNLADKSSSHTRY